MKKFRDNAGNEFQAESYEHALEKVLCWNETCIEEIKEEYCDFCAMETEIDSVNNCTICGRLVIDHDNKMA